MLLLKESQQLYAPHGCFVCGARTFPMLDTTINFSAFELRVYICEIHGREIAKAFGLIEGDEHDDLLRVRQANVVLIRERDQEIERRERLEGIAELHRAEIDGLEQAVEREQSRSAQLEQQIHAMIGAAQATAAAVSNGGHDGESD